MKTHILPVLIGLALVLSPGLASAACYADYKAKRDAPLRLHYGVMEVSDAACGSKDRAAAEVAERLKRGDWTLLTVVSVFGEDGLEKRKESAGEFYLRF